MAALSGCSGAPSLALVGGRRVDAAAIDADPLALLPSNIIMFAYVDLQAAFRSTLAADINTLMSSFLPLSPEANFSPMRDTTRLYGGLYAMQGMDFCAVAQGRFDIAAISRAADARTVVGGTAPLVKTRYADCDMYTVGNVGFVPLTSQTMLAGNETGMRRALDRLRQRRIERNVPQWMVDLSSNPLAHLAIAGDFGAESVMSLDSAGRSIARPSAGAAAALPVLESAARGFPFLDGVRAIRALGQFAPPGVNVVGTITYDTDARAEAGSSALAHVGDINPIMNLLISVGLGGSIRNPQVARAGRDVAFVEPMEEALVRGALGYLGRR